MSENFDWKALFLDNTPVSTPNYSSNTLTVSGDARGNPLTNYANKMARLALFIGAEEAKLLKTKFTNMDALIDRLTGSVANSTQAPLGSYGYIDFLMQSANHSVREVISVEETLDDLYAGYSFGQSPPVFQYSAVFLNNKQDQQAHKMFLIYRELLRAHALAHHRMLAYVIYDGYMASGYLQDFSWALRSDDESFVSGQFSLLVKGFKLLDEAAVRQAKTFAAGTTEITVQPTSTAFSNSRASAAVVSAPTAVSVEVD